MTKHSTANRAFPLPLEGGGWNATDLARQSHGLPKLPTGELSPMAFLVGVMGAPCRNGTPTRCVQRLSVAVVPGAKSAKTALSRGRIALPPHSRRRHCLRRRGRNAERRFGAELSRRISAGGRGEYP